jgi:FkbM family methyltransferase
MKTCEELKIVHEQRQAGVSLNEICIREGITIPIVEESRFGFEFFCWRSPEMKEEMDCFIEYSKGRKSLLDIGALHGIFSLVFTELNKGSKAYAFEPSPKPYAVLNENTLLTGNTRPFNRALSDGFGVLEMYQQWDHYVLGAPQLGVKGAIVKCFSGDTFCEDYPPIDTIKIDVEGMELRVLKGLRMTISKSHPLIFLELHPERVEQGDIETIIEMLKFWKYTAIDSRTKKDISFEEILEFKSGELRLILS